jgi:hypothetical protein
VKPEMSCPEGLSSPGSESVVERLERWQEFGGVWRVLARTPDRVTISFCRCDDGEEVDRVTFRAPQLLHWLGDRTDC